MKRKAPTDKDLRLYTRLSDVDSDLILDSAIPKKTASRASLWVLLRRPQYASVALAALLLTLTAVALLVTGITKGPQTEPTTHGSRTEQTEQNEPSGPVTLGKPTMENAAALRKGMSFTELTALMGNDYTQDGRRYTFTLDTGEQLAVDTEIVYSISSTGGGSRVTGFEWLDETAKTVNPTDLPAELLQKLQDYATDKIFPVYAMTSLIGKYNKELTTPSVEAVLEGAELRYLRVGTDGETVLLDAKGVKTKGDPSAAAFLNDVSRLFDESVRIRAYYPITTSYAAEVGAVYLQTSIGDYILYLLRDGPLFVPEGEDLPAADPVPYLLPVGVFHQFAYDMVDKGATLGFGWGITEERMAVIEPYRITAEGYQKPVNLATPEAAEKVTVGSHYYGWADAMGTCIGCRQNGKLGYFLNSGEYEFVITPSNHLHYWELTDGRGLVVSTKMTESYSGIGSVFRVSVVLYTDSADVLYEIGTLSTATVSLLRKDMSHYAVNTILGTAAYSGYDSSVVLWNEDGLVHTCALTWSRYKPGGTVPTTEYLLDTYTHSTCSIAEAAEEIKVGMSFADIVARLGPCRDGHEVGTFGETKRGYHFWTLPDGRCLAAYVGYDIPILADPFGMTYENHFNMSVMQILWLDSEEEIEAIGTPSLSRARSIEAGMKPEVLKALMGEPTTTVSSLAFIWEWNEDGKVYTCTVYLQNNRPEGLFKNFDSVYRCEITEEPLTSLPIPDKDPTPEDAARITEGMTTSALLKVMGSRVQRTTLVDAELYCWTLSDGRIFCALTEGDVTHPEQDERVVTYTFYRGSMEDVSVSTAENMEAVTEGMSLSTVYALLGTEAWDEDYDYPSSLTVQWGTSTGAWWEISVFFEAVEHPETNRYRAYATYVHIERFE